MTGSWAVPPRFAVQALTEERRSPSAQVSAPVTPAGARLSSLGNAVIRALGGSWGNLPVSPDPFHWSAFGGPVAARRAARVSPQLHRPAFGRCRWGAHLAASKPSFTRS
jgi:hypothetical protein